MAGGQRDLRIGGRDPGDARRGPVHRRGAEPVAGDQCSAVPAQAGRDPLPALRCAGRAALVGQPGPLLRQRLQRRRPGLPDLRRGGAAGHPHHRGRRQRGGLRRVLRPVSRRGRLDRPRPAQRQDRPGTPEAGRIAAGGPDGPGFQRQRAVLGEPQDRAAPLRSRPARAVCGNEPRGRPLAAGRLPQPEAGRVVPGPDARVAERPSPPASLLPQGLHRRREQGHADDR